MFQTIKKTLTNKFTFSKVVKDVQSKLIALGYDVGSAGDDGFYGEASEGAVKRFQRDNFVNGEVDEHTMNKINELYEKNKSKKNHFKTIKYPLTIDDYIKEEFEKTAVVLHLTAGGASAYNTIDWFNQAAGVIATPYVISRNMMTRFDFKAIDGEVLECFDSKYWAYHTGKGAFFDQRTIGIEICNYGPLTRYSNGEFYTKTNTPINIPKEDVEEIDFRGCKYWQKITDKQIESIVNLLRHLKEKHPKLNFKGNYEGNWTEFSKNHVNLSAKGVYVHTNLVESWKFLRWDMPPFKNLSEALKSL